MALCNRVAEVRQAAGLSVYELCVRAGLFSDKGVMVTRSIVRLESGENATVELALAIFAVLKETGHVSKFEDLFWIEDFDVNKNVEKLKEIRSNKPKTVKKTRVNKNTESEASATEENAPDDNSEK